MASKTCPVWGVVEEAGFPAPTAFWDLFLYPLPGLCGHLDRLHATCRHTREWRHPCFLHKPLESHQDIFTRKILQPLPHCL